MRPRSRRAIRSFLAGVLAGGLTLGASAAAFAVGDPDDNGRGRLELNADVLVNDSVATGVAGDFAIRGRLFSEELSARAREQRAAGAERLGAVGALTFEPRDIAADEYQALRGELFESYASEALSQAHEPRDEAPVPHVLVLAAAAPLVLITGVLLGRFWVRRRRAVS